MITNYAIRVRAEQDELVDEYLSSHPEKAERIAKMRTSWFGRAVIISLLLGREEALRRYQ